MRRILLLVALALCVPFVAQAHGNVFFSFTTENPEALFVSEVQVPYQVFRAQNDFISGVDFWIDNRGSAGDATFTLVDDNENPLASRTIAIPSIPVTLAGEKLHVDFPSPAPLIAGEFYGIRIASTMPDLRLFYGERLRILTHNEQYFSQYINDFARLGQIGQNFSFLFSFYETAETVSPIISNVVVRTTERAEAHVTFNANEPIDYRIAYHRAEETSTESTSFRNEYTFCNEGINTCDIVIAVFPGATYIYELIAKDVWGNTTSVNGSFVIENAPPPDAPPPLPSPSPNGNDTTPPLFINPRIVALSDRTASIAWSTNEAASGVVIVSLARDPRGQIVILRDPVFELEHFFETGMTLSPYTSYVASLVSADFSGNIATSTLSFTTENSPPGPTPTPTPTLSPTPTPFPSGGNNAPSPSPSPPNGDNTNPGNPDLNSLPPPSTVTGAASESAGGSVTIGWTKPEKAEPDGYRIDVFNQKKELEKQTFVSARITKVTITGLSAGGHYAIVYADYHGVFEKIGTPANFTIELRSVNESTTTPRAVPASASSPRKFFLIIPAIIVLGAGAWIFFKLKKG